MKKVLFILTAALTAFALVTSCQRKEDPEMVNAMAKVATADVVDAAAAAYAVWEEDNTLPETLSVPGTAITKASELKLTQPQYQYALAKAIVNIAAGKTDEILVQQAKAAQHPERDSYDKTDVAVKNGPAIKDNVGTDAKDTTEDIVAFANRFSESILADKTVPNSVLIVRDGNAIAFSTNRLTVCMLRTLAEYKKAGSLPATITTEYLSAAATLKGFAQQFVKILDIWEQTVGTVSADGSHCTDNNSAWENVHFVPIPHSGGAYVDGKDQYDVKYQPYFTVEIDGTTYTSAQTWGIALRGILDLITTEGSAKKQVNRNPFEHTLGNGASLKEPIPGVIAEDIWGQYPWYESTNDAQPINKTEFTPYLIARCAAWFLTRQEALGKIGNYQIFGTDPDSGFVDEGVDGFVCSMRMWLIAARFYKYLLDNNITENVYDAVKDVTFSTDLYGVEMPDIDLKTKTVTVASDGTAVNATFVAKKAWTATASESWIHVDPASGEAGTNVSIAISADANTGDAREGKVLVKGGNVTEGLAITVTQSKYVDPSSISLKEFAQEFVKGLEVWEATVGTVESENKHLIEKGTAWENVHFIPVGKTGGEYDNHPGNQHDDKYTPWVLNVGGKQFTSAQAWEIATRGLLDMVLTDGQGYIAKMTSRNKPGYTHGDYKSFSELMTVTPSESARWNAYPWYEEDGVTYNGQPFNEVGIDLITKATLGHLVRGLVGIPGVFNPLGAIGNFQEFGTDDSALMLDGYRGLISPMRELILLMRVYKYLLDNNIDKNVYSAIKDVKFDYDMYHQGEAPSSKATIKDFAKEYVKILDIWAATTGEVVMHPDAPSETVANAHYVPSTTTITVGGKTYTTADMFETALRSYLLVRGYNGLDTENYGKGKIAALDGGALSMSATEVPETHGYAWGSYPYNETSGNGGHLVMGTKDDNEHCKVKVDILDNWAMRSLNYSKGNPITNLCGYSGGQLDGYYGCFCSQRALITYAFFFKYMLDNNLDKGTDVAADQIIRSELFGDEGGAAPTLKEFAQEFVKGLDVWQATVGTVESESAHLIEKGTAWQNVHFIPIVPNPDCEYISHGGNQYDSKYTPWKLNVGGTEISSSQAWEIAIRGLMNMVTAEGEEFLPTMDDRNKAYTLKDNKGLDSVMPAASEANKWGKHPWYEGGDDERVKFNGNEIETVDVNFMVKVGAWHVVRSFIKTGGNSSPLGMVGNFQQFGTSSSTLKLDGYDGLIAPMRELLVLMRIYKYLLDNNITSNVYSAIKDQKFSFDLYGASGAGSKGIKTADELIAWLADPSTDASLEADIDLTGKTFAPDTLTAAFDGKNHKITYTLSYEGSEKVSDNAQIQNLGLFKVVEGSVKNLRTAGAINFNPAAGTGTYHVGGIAGMTESGAVIDNCTNGVDILATTKVTHHIGGIVGFTEADTKLDGCKNTGKVEMIIPELAAANASQLGGIVGHIEASGTFTNLVNDGPVTYAGLGTPRIAGICGYVNNLTDVTFKNCTNNGKLLVNEGKYNASTWSYVGGITGYYGTPAHNSKVLYDTCVNNGDIEINVTEEKTKMRVGGIVSQGGKSDGTYGEGELVWTVVNCTNNGNISCTSTTANNLMGGIIGFTETTCKVICDGCTNNGAISVAGKGRIGGILGQGCSIASTFTNFTVGANTSLTVGADGMTGLIMANKNTSNSTEVTTAMTGKVLGGTIVKNGETTTITADNFAANLLGYTQGSEGGSLAGVTFGN
ncbi:MAG: BACON domain-containing protein [Bacteroidales bacterium]|nr:BACON domain-containing protein [Bacteroidales bacterium]